MDITWYGLSCFRLMERGQTTVVTDPYADTIGLPPLRVRGDVVTISHHAPGHNASNLVKGVQYVLDGAGEYEFGGVFITGVPLHHVKEDMARRNVAYLMKYPTDVTVLHLGDLSQVPDQSTIEDLGEVHVVLVPVGGGNTITPAAAAEVIALIEPYFIIPMHYQQPGLNIELEPVDRFLKAVGVSRVNEMDMLRITAADVREQPEVVLLTPNISENV